MLGISDNLQSFEKEYLNLHRRRPNPNSNPSRPIELSIRIQKPTNKLNKKEQTYTDNITRNLIHTRSDYIITQCIDDMRHSLG